MEDDPLILMSGTVTVSTEDKFHPFFSFVSLLLHNGLQTLLGTTAKGVAESVLHTWVSIRVFLVAPILNTVTVVCLALSVMILAEKVLFGIVSLTVSIFKLKPEKRYRWEQIKPDLEAGNSNYPMVLIQIPMYNEKEVYKKSIGAACELDWPKDRLVVQVLDDSTDPIVKDLIKMECDWWKSKGVNLWHQTRCVRKGYKAGALKDGMNHSYIKDCEYVVMFDADFQPESDFLNRAVPYLVHNPKLALVQARWKFVNADECMLTRIQEMSLDYHFKIEQESGSSMCSFFGFNGTAGIWRMQAIEEAGGWNDRTTVEDMDLAVRACLQGWRFLYVGDIKAKSELPSSFKAYRYQQHRWSCGPANLFKKIAMEVISNKRISIWRKIYIIYSFFFIGKVASHTVTFVFYCFLIPISVLIPEVQIPFWGIVYVPLATTILKAFGTPSSAHLIVFWVLFENVMSLHRLKAAVTGLMEFGRVHEWIVTEKLGDTLKSIIHRQSTSAPVPVTTEGTQQMTKKLEDNSEADTKIEDPKKPRFRLWHRFHNGELAAGVFLVTAGAYDVMFESDGFYIYLFLQALAFFIAGFDCVGT